MSFISKIRDILKPETKSYGPPSGLSGDPFTGRLFGGNTSSTGVSVTPWTSLGSASVYAAVKALSEDMARLPLCVDRRSNTGGWDPHPYHPLCTVFRKPNRWQNAFDYIAFMTMSHVMNGNAYSVIIRDNTGLPISLIPISPERVQVMLGASGEIWYSVGHPLLGANEQLMIPSDDVLHIKGMSLNGYLGISPISTVPEAIGLALASQKHGANTFANGASISGVLTHPNQISPEAAARMRASWKDAYSGAQNAGKVALLEEGLVYNSIGMTLEDSQYLATREFQVIEIARIFRVPPHKLFDLSDAHYQNAAAMNQDYVDNALLPIALRMQQEMEQKLFFTSEQNLYRIKFDFDDLLRSDQKTRYDTYAVGINAGVLAVNEVRNWEGLSPVDGGEKPRTQAQNVPLSDPNPMTQKPDNDEPKD